MTKVAFLTDAPKVGGSEIWLLEVLPRLLGNGLEATMLLSDRENLNPLAERMSQRGVRVERFSQTWELSVLSKEFDLRVLQGWNPIMYSQVLPHLARPKAVVIHDQMKYQYPFGLEAFYRWGFGFTKAKHLVHADRVITVSKWSAEYMHKNYGLHKVIAIRNGIDLARFHPPSTGEHKRLREKLGFKGFVVVYAARLALEKNHWALLQTARLTPGIRYILLGDGELRSVLTPLAPSNVEFWGRRWDVPEIYRAADASLQPTLAENQSLSTLEAMASGLPVITTNIPAQQEIIEHGVDGFLLPAKAKLFAQTLRQLQHDPALWQRIAGAAYAKVAQKHTLDQTAQSFLEVLQGISRGTGQPD